jgi:hypothetical protein
VLHVSALEKSGSDKGLEAGIKAAISVVVLVVFGLIGLAVIQKRRAGRKLGQHLPHDPSQALQIDADGNVLQESVKSLTSPIHNDVYDFENQMAVEVERPKTPSQENGNSNGNGGHGRII